VYIFVCLRASIFSVSITALGRVVNCLGMRGLPSRQISFLRRLFNCAFL
jgi:hypothetical protein